MSKRILQIVENAYRATVEEQDDTVVWFTHAMRAGGAELTVVLRGNAVNYAVRGQDASGLQFGTRKQTRPPDLARDVARLVARGVPLHAVAADVVDRGIDAGAMVDGVRLIDRDEIARLIAEHDLVFHW
ncbi:MAG TPA: DsrE family protein [Candidatus Tectomicrobia bacterium]|nr:DsrE family protein [Candidatus Tectomicrobia bacterium]